MMTVEDIVNKLNIKVVTTTTDEFRCLCPFHEEQTASFSINRRTGKFICFAGCGAGGLVSLVARKLSISFDAANKYIYGEDSVSGVTQETKQPSEKYMIKRVALPDEFRLIREPDTCPQYLLNRLKFDTIKNFAIGRCEIGYFQNRIIIPVMYKQKICGFVARDYSGNASKPYLFPKGFKSRDFLFNYDNINSDEVIIVEGPFDAMAMYEKGFRNTVCIFGIDMSIRQVKLLAHKGVKKLVMCLDNDDQKKQNHGLRAAHDLASRFKYIFESVSMMQLPSARDPDECNQMELSQAYRHRKFFSNKTNPDITTTSGRFSLTR